MLKEKKILIAVTGSIAAYKIATLVRLFVKNGAEVKVIMTKAATQFIPALTLSTLSKNEVLHDLYSDDTWANHVMLGRWADAMIIAPASCNTIAKMAHGVCDNLLLAVYLSATCPVFISPAMDEDMWLHPSTKKNLSLLHSFGNIILPVIFGELASGLTGVGRMMEPEGILDFFEHYFQKNKELTGKKILISAGPTNEPLDPVRFIGNHSTGKMGIALANECKNRGADVTLVLGPSSELVPAKMNIIRVTTASEMYEACVNKFIETDIALMCAAVADYTPLIVSKEKIKKKEDTFVVELKKTNDILKRLGQLKTKQQILVGFALETTDEESNAIKKLAEKNADFMVLNSLNDEGAGFGHNTNKITIFDRAQNKFLFETKNKDEIAVDIINTILKS
jgi:phosphopantothenoylcysteine decarboxylase/phosphopantothenate--cysteine ligase